MVKVGEVVPDFEADAYFPEKDDIGKLRFSDYLASGSFWPSTRRTLPSSVRRSLRSWPSITTSSRRRALR
ncbi:hypothetical protein [Thermococcus sp. JCM 11816]|uniref:hypothetical protein n=1 Tax=Thermococcus sp. (strain JCM 11816 / KS-1) TaxID=1295125 RepID=UPI000AE19603